jgi:hypothetical protein
MCALHVSFAFCIEKTQKDLNPCEISTSKKKDKAKVLEPAMQLLCLADCVRAARAPSAYCGQVPRALLKRDCNCLSLYVS